MTRLKTLLATSALAWAAVAAPAQAATTLLDLVNPPTQSFTPFSLAFIANSTSATLSVGGYQVPDSAVAAQNVVALTGGGSNLLGPTWTLAEAVPGSGEASTDSDGSSVPALIFQGTNVGLYDVFSQTLLNLTPGSSYTYSFLFFNNLDGGGNAPSGLRVTVDGGSLPGAVPEPATWAMLLVGFAIAGAAMRPRPKVSYRFT